MQSCKRGLFLTPVVLTFLISFQTCARATVCYINMKLCFCILDDTLGDFQGFMN